MPERPLKQEQTRSLPARRFSPVPMFLHGTRSFLMNSFWQILFAQGELLLWLRIEYLNVKAVWDQDGVGIFFCWMGGSLIEAVARDAGGTSWRAGGGASPMRSGWPIRAGDAEVRGSLRTITIPQQCGAGCRWRISQGVIFQRRPFLMRTVTLRMRPFQIAAMCSRLHWQAHPAETRPRRSRYVGDWSYYFVGAALTPPDA